MSSSFSHDGDKKKAHIESFGVGVACHCGCVMACVMFAG